MKANNGKPPLVSVYSPKISNKKQRKSNMLIEQNNSASKKSSCLVNSIPLSPRRMRTYALNVEEKGNLAHVSGTKSFKTVFKLSQSGQKQQLLQQQSSFTDSAKPTAMNLNRNPPNDADEELKIKLQNYNSQQKYDSSIALVGSQLQVSKFNLPFENTMQNPSSPTEQVQPQNERLPANTFLAGSQSAWVLPDQSADPQIHNASAGASSNGNGMMTDQKFQNTYLPQSIESPRFTEIMRMGCGSSSQPQQKQGGALFRTHD